MFAELYTKADCSYCVRAKNLLESNNISYREMIISQGVGETELKSHQVYVTKADLLEKLPNAKTVPQIWLNGNYIGGYTELAAFMDKTS